MEKQKRKAELDLPQKKFYRQRAHSNPLADHRFDVPLNPDVMDWSAQYPKFFSAPGSAEASQQPVDEPSQVDFLDIGCGYGGMLVALAPMFPDKLMLGLEIRVKVSDYVHDRILALRSQHEDQYQNIAVLRTNAMKYLPNFFRKGQLSKLFFLYPDPHFKKQKHKWRIINEQLLAEYAYVMAVGGIVYTITDVIGLHTWMVKYLEEHPLFVRMSEAETEADPIVPKLYDSTEEGKKVYRNKAAGQDHGDGDVRVALFRRIANPHA
eukprot:gene4519-5830_t